MPVPQERDFFQNLNTIKTLIESTCEEKWDVLIETALPAAGEALWLLLIPSPEEILENYLNPGRSGKGGRGTRAGTGRRQLTRYGQLRWWQKISFPDVDQIISDALPGSQAIKGRRLLPGEKWFWHGVDVIDRGLWYWLLLEVGDTFVSEWASGIVESRFCTSPLNALFIGNGTGLPPDNSGPFWNQPSEVHVSSNVGWTLVSSGKIGRQNPLVGVSGPILATFDATYDPAGRDRPTTCRLQMTVQHPDAPSTIYLSDTVSPKRGDSFSLSIEGAAENAIAVTFDINLTGASFVVPLIDVSWTAQAWCTPDA